MSLSPGRQHDLDSYYKLLRNEQSPYKRNRIKDRIQKLMRESERPDVMHMRKQIIEAYKRRDTPKVEAIGEELWRRTRI